MIKKIPWKSGYIVIDYTIDKLNISALNNSFELKPRTIVVSKFDKYVEAVNRRRYIYIYFIEELKPFINSNEVVFRENDIDFYEINYTKLDYDEYYTIILPGHFIYEYIVLTSDELAVMLSIKRRVFYERVDSKLVLYIV